MSKRSFYGSSQDQLRHLSKSVQIEETKNPQIAWATTMVLSLCVFAFLGWASIAKLTELARTVGTIEPLGYERDIQHLDGGMTTEIFVEEGQRVDQGDLILTLDGADLKGDLARAKDRLSSLQIEQIRLSSYVGGAPEEYSSMTSNAHPRVENAKALNFALRQALEDKLEISDQQVRQKREDILILKQQLRQGEVRLLSVEDRLARQTELMKKGYVAGLVVETTKESVEEIKNENSILASQIANAERAVEEFLGRRQSIISEDRSIALQQLSAIDAQISETEELVIKLSAKVARLSLRAPVDGIVKGISALSVGSLVRPASSITKIVPTNEALVAHIQISPKDIARISIGTVVRLKLSAFEFDRYGYIEGTLSKISAATFVSTRGETYYAGEVELERNFIGDNPDQNQLIPGMAVSADIVTGYKTVLQYLLQPIRSAMSTALTEA